MPDKQVKAWQIVQFVNDDVQVLVKVNGKFQEVKGTFSASSSRTTKICVYFKNGKDVWFDREDVVTVRLPESE
jgi:hypothetical protein